MDGSKSLPNGPAGPRSAGAPASVLLLLSLLTGSARPAVADGISGRVFGPDGKPVPNAVLAARPDKGQPVEFRTDGSGSFSVFLDPGRYAVSPRGDASLVGVLESYSQPVQQDVHLKKAGR